MKSVFSHNEFITPNIVSLYFTPEPEFDYLAGQYIELTFPDEHNSSIGDNRWFTLSSSPSESHLMITTKLNKPLSQFKDRLINLKAGDEVLMSEPIGDFVLPIDKSIPLVFISGGIGITPVRSIIKWLSDKNEQREITLNYIVKNDYDFIFEEIFKYYKLDYKPITTENSPSSDWVANKFQDGASPLSLFFISGPQIMVERIVDDITKDYGNNQVIMDYFPGYNSL